ncbi:MAG: ribonuclease D [Gammaproteobacteria bacterium]
MTVPSLIERPAQLEAFVAEALQAPWLGLDTEFVRDRNYFPRAGLIQIATPDAVALVDPVALEDLSALAPLLFATKVEKILHAGRQDLELFVLLFDRVPAPLFDTQTAADLIGLAPQIGYATLVAELLSADTGRSLGRYDWLRRPLAPEALDYAAGDVHYLAVLRDILQPRLATAGKETTFTEAMTHAADPALYRPDPEGAWRRVHAARRLRGNALVRFKALAAWREKQAIAEDRPRQWILRDGPLVAIARNGPCNTEGFAAIHGLNPSARRRYTPEMLAVMASAGAGYENDRDGASLTVDA